MLLLNDCHTVINLASICWGFNFLCMIPILCRIIPTSTCLKFIDNKSLCYKNWIRKLSNFKTEIMKEMTVSHFLLVVLRVQRKMIPISNNGAQFISYIPSELMFWIYKEKIMLWAFYTSHATQTEYTISYRSICIYLEIIGTAFSLPMNLHRKHSIRKTTPSEVVKVTKKGSSLHLAKTNILLQVVTIEFTHGKTKTANMSVSPKI